MNLLKNLCFILILISNNLDLVKPIKEATDKYLLPTNVIPHHYDIRFIFDTDVFKVKSYCGVVEILLEVLSTQPIYVIKLHAKQSQLSIMDVRLKDKNRDYIVHAFPFFYDSQTDIYEIHSEKGLTKNNYTLKIDFKGNFSTQNMKGFYMGTYKDSSKTYNFAVTQLEPIYARTVFPCFDEPRFKATFNITASYPSGYGFLTNTLPYTKYQPTIERNIVTTRHEVTPKMSTYLLAIVISEFTCDKGYGLHNNTQFYVCSRNQTKHLRKFTLKYTPLIVREVESILGISYSESGIKKLTQVAIPGFLSGGMENWGLMTFRELALLKNEELSSNSEKQSTLTLIAHEILHQWFGNLVTLREWTYLFLNEGFAEFLQF